MIVDLKPATARLAELVVGVRDDQLWSPTPCAAMAVATLLDHVAGLSVAFTLAAAKEVPEGGSVAPDPDGRQLSQEFRSQIPELLHGLSQSWRSPEAWTGMTRAGGVDLPGDVGGLVALDEVVLHGWDLAVATGQPFDVDAAAAAAVHGFVSGFAGPGHDDDRAGLFGPEVPVDDDAPILDRILGMAGREPAWTPRRIA